MSKERPGRVQGAGAGKLSGNREKILSAALRLFTAQGVDAIQTAQISKEANVSTGTLFYYFPDKNSLVDQLYLSNKKEMEEEMEEMADSIRTSDDESLKTKQRFWQCLRGYIAWGTENPEKCGSGTGFATPRASGMR